MREVLDIRWCDEHLPAREGSDDEHVDSSAFLSGTAEAGGDVNRRWCELFHRPAVETVSAGSARRNGRKPTRRAVRSVDAVEAADEEETD